MTPAPVPEPDAVGSYRFVAELWRYPGDAGWHFVTLPPAVADEIDLLAATARRGFGSVRVQVTVGATTWQTSVFPDKASASFLLPVKKAVRSAEGLDDGRPVSVALVVLDVP